MMLDLSLFSKYRSELMGVATLLIILCHMPAHGVAMPSIVSSVIIYGGLGCDIFLFLSGMGMWYSLRKNETAGLGGAILWIKRRLIRILIPYLLFAIPCFAIYAIKDEWTIETYLWRVSTLSFWTEGWGLWYISLTLVLYLITPLLGKILCGTNKWVWLTILVLLTWSLGSLPGLEGLAEHMRFAVCRVPSYLIGFSLAEKIKDGKLIKMIFLVIPLITLLAGSILLRFMGYVSFSLFWIEGIVLLICVTLMINGLKKYNCMLSTFAFIGGISLESYCTNVFALLFFMYVPWYIGDVNINPGNWTYYVVGTICCLVLSVIINRTSKKILNIFYAKKI